MSDDSDPKDWDDIRHEVREFALLMEKKLRVHDASRGKTGWKIDTISSLVTRVKEETLELCDEAYKPISDVDLPNVVGEAVDVANMAMMVADVACGLPYPQRAQSLRQVKAAAGPRPVPCPGTGELEA